MTSRGTFCVMLVFTASAVAADEKLQFDGYMITANGALFVLSSADGAKSGWIPLGRNFGRFALVDFDPRSETITVEHEGRRTSISLRPSVIRDQNDPKERLRSLDGLELAYELAKQGDSLIAALLSRHHALTVAIERDKKHVDEHRAALQFTARQIESTARERKARILSVK